MLKEPIGGVFMNEKVSFSKRVKKFFQGKKSVSNNIYNSAWVQDKNLNLSSDSALHQKLQLLSLHLEQAEYIGNIGTWEYCPRKKEFTLSKMSSKILEWPYGKTLPEKKLLSMIHDEDFSKMKTFLDRPDNGIDVRICPHKMTEVRHVTIIGNIVNNKDEREKLIGVINDRTSYVQFEKEVQKTEKRFQYVFDHLDVGIWMRNFPEENLIFASKGVEKTFQVPLETMNKYPKRWMDIILPEYRDEVESAYDKLEKGEKISIRYRIQAGDGTTKWIHEQIVPRMNQQGKVTHLFGMITDITVMVELKKRIEYLATYDELTSLPNVHSLDRKINELITRKDIATFAILTIDLDNFHWVNNYLGRKLSDQVLQTVANRIHTVLPKNNYLARESSDTFIALVMNCDDKDEVFTLAEKIIQAIEKDLHIHGYDIYVTGSMGISFYPDDGIEKLELLERSQTALFHAKQLGKNNYQIYSFDKDIGTHKRYVLETDLRKAIKNNDFLIHYQPQINPQNNALIGAEALIRWPHHVWGLVSPEEFIPLAEETHLIHEISKLVVQAVCQQLKEWKTNNYTLIPISINVSPISFLKSNFVEMMKESISKYQIPSRYIVLEITESSILENEKRVADVLRELKALGVHVALDDFGTGYSVLNNLQRYNLDILKIDRSFIQTLNIDEGHDSKDAVIVSSLIYLSQGLGMKVVAEGVEEYEQLQFLKQKECDVVQGYIYSKPVPSKELEIFLKHPYLKPLKQKKIFKPKEERRRFYRLEFTFPVLTKLQISEVNDRKVDVGSANILMENIGVGGIRFLSNLRLPVLSSLRLHFKFTLMGKSFYVNGTLVYRNDEQAGIYVYGVSFESMSEGERDELAEIINKITVLRKLGEEIPETEFVQMSPYTFFSQ